MGLLAGARILRDRATLSQLIKERNRILEGCLGFGLFASGDKGLDLLDSGADGVLLFVVLLAGELIGLVTLALGLLFLVDEAQDLRGEVFDAGQLPVFFGGDAEMESFI